MVVTEAVTSEISMGMRMRCVVRTTAVVHWLDYNRWHRFSDWGWNHRGRVIRHRSADMVEGPIAASHLG